MTTVFIQGGENMRSQIIIVLLITGIRRGMYFFSILMQVLKHITWKVLFSTDTVSVVEIYVCNVFVLQVINYLHLFKKTNYADNGNI